MNTQVTKNRDRQYKVILFLVIGLSVISSAVRDLNQIRLAVMDTSGLITELADRFMPSPTVAPAVFVDTAEPTTCVAMTNFHSRKDSDVESEVELNEAHVGVSPVSSTDILDEVKTRKSSEQNENLKAHSKGSVAADAHASDVAARIVDRNNRDLTRTLARVANGKVEVDFKRGVTDLRQWIEFASLAKSAHLMALPMTVSTEVDIRKVSDVVSSEIPMGKVSIKDRKVMKRPGSTSRQFLFKTSNGSINVRAAS